MGYVPRTPFETAEAAHAVRDRAIERQERQWEQSRASANTGQYRADSAQLNSLRARLEAAEAGRLAALRQANDAHAARHRAEHGDPRPSYRAEVDPGTGRTTYHPYYYR
jgi:hypothetical protein